MDYFKLNIDSGTIINKFIFILMLLLPATLFSQFGSSAKYKINTIIIEGNNHFSDNAITKNIKLSNTNFFSKQRLSKSMIKTDKLIIKTFYLKNGFLKCNVQDSLSIDDNNIVNIYFFIDEGEQYFLNEIQITGNHIFETDRLEKWLDLDKGAPYNPIKIRKSIETLHEHYENQGKPFAVISDSLTLDSTSIKLNLNIDEGRTMTINRVTIKNNKDVLETVIRRELAISKDDIYSRKKIEKSKMYLLNLGLFTTVNINYANIDTVNNKIDLVVYVREQDMRYWEFNTGIVQTEGLGTEVKTTLNVSAQWRHKNISKKARGLRASTEVGVNPYDIYSQPDINADMTYLEPWLFGFRSTTLFRLFVEDLERKQYDYTKYGLETSLIINPDKRNYMKAGFEISGIANRFEAIDTVSVFQDKETESERAFIIDFTRDRRNDFLFPSNGHLFTFTGKITSSIIGGTEDYFKFETSYSEYFKIYKNFVFAYRAKIGYMAPYGPDENAPEYEKFYMGGATSMRGWENLMFLTKTAEDGTRIADRKRVKILTSFDLRFPIIWIIGGEIFFDGGNLISDIPSLRNSQYRWNFGFGLTVATPLGPARIDLARPLIKDTKKWVPQFAISYAF